MTATRWIFLLGCIAILPSIMGAEAELKVEIKDVKPQTTLVIRKTIKQVDVGKELGVILPKVFGYADSKQIKPLSAPFTRYLKKTEDEFEIEAGIAVPDGSKGEGDIVVSSLPGGKAAFTIHTGAYEKLKDTYAAMMKWLTDNKKDGAGGPWEVYVSDPGSGKPEDLKTEIYFPLK
jgi:AraC family transcriptional regulator